MREMTKEEWLEHDRLVRKNYYEEHKAECAAYMKANYQENREARLEYLRKYNQIGRKNGLKAVSHDADYYLKGNKALLNAVKRIQELKKEREKR